MRLSWNEIRVRAKRFSDDWKDAHYEKGETQSFTMISMPSSVERINNYEATSSIEYLVVTGC